MSSVVEEIRIGTDYAKVREKLGIPVVNSEEKLEWCNKDFEEMAYGLYPSIQITARDGIVTEVLITPNFEKYKALHTDFSSKEDIELIWKDSISCLEELYGTPVKDKENKKAWEVGDGSTIKIEKEKVSSKYTINIILK